jgi:hypothetical protein
MGIQNSSNVTLYDQEAVYVRAEMFKHISGMYATYASEYSRILVKDMEFIIKSITNRGYEPFHIRNEGYRQFGKIKNRNEKNLTYYCNRAKTSMICTVVKNKDLDTAKKEDPFWDDTDEAEFDGRRFNFIAIQTTNVSEYHWFRNIISENISTEETKNKLFMLRSTDFGSFELDSFPMEDVKCDIGMNYGKEFTQVNQKIIENLTEKKSGLYIFNGPPGTGKTFYIKYLTNAIDNRKFILVPNTIVDSIFSPKMVQNIYTFKDSVLILEDAELCVFKRDGTNNELVSGILNITDGLLKDLLNISIIVTFNSSEIEQLDKALLRKGRLRAIYKFDYLSRENAQKLLNDLDKKYDATGPMTLADIYNVDDEVDLGGETVPNQGVGFSSVH